MITKEGEVLGGVVRSSGVVPENTEKKTREGSPVALSVAVFVLFACLWGI